MHRSNALIGLALGIAILSGCDSVTNSNPKTAAPVDTASHVAGSPAASLNGGWIRRDTSSLHKIVGTMFLDSSATSRWSTWYFGTVVNSGTFKWTATATNLTTMTVSGAAAPASTSWARHGDTLYLKWGLSTQETWLKSPGLPEPIATADTAGKSVKVVPDTARVPFKKLWHVVSGNQVDDTYLDLRADTAIFYVYSHDTAWYGNLGTWTVRKDSMYMSSSTNAEWAKISGVKFLLKKDTLAAVTTLPTAKVTIPAVSTPDTTVTVTPVDTTSHGKLKRADLQKLWGYTTDTLGISWATYFDLRSDTAIEYDVFNNAIDTFRYGVWQLRNDSLYLGAQYDAYAVKILGGKLSMDGETYSVQTSLPQVSTKPDTTGVPVSCNVGQLDPALVGSWRWDSTLVEGGIDTTFTLTMTFLKDGTGQMYSSAQGTTENFRWGVVGTKLNLVSLDSTSDCSTSSGETYSVSGSSFTIFPSGSFAIQMKKQ